MNFELSDEQGYLVEAARGALGRVKTLEAARAALEGEPLPDLWPTARDAGWTGLLLSEEVGGAGLGTLDALLVAIEVGRVLAGVPLVGHVAATGLLSAAASVDRDLLAGLATGERRAALVPARPADDVVTAWTVDALRGRGREAAPRVQDGRITGRVCWVPDLPGADVLVCVGLEEGHPRATIVDAAAEGVMVEAVTRYDATRALGHVTFEGARVTRLDVADIDVAASWYMAGAMLAAEALGAVEECLRMAVEYAKERHTFGRAIGSYQAIKHTLVEVLRRQENLRSLLYYTGFAREDLPTEFALAASAARVAGEEALDHATRELISVHGGIGATWEHDAPLYFRRAQLQRLLLGGEADAADRVSAELFAQADAVEALAGEPTAARVAAPQGPAPP